MTGKCIAKHVFNCMEMLNIRKVLSVFRCNSLDYRKLKDREEFYYCCSFLHENTRSFIKAVTLLLSSPWNSGVLWSLLFPRLLSISAGYWYVLRWLRRNCACIFFFHYLFFFCLLCFSYSGLEVHLFEIPALCNSFKSSFISFICIEPWKIGVSRKWLSNCSFLI